MSCWVEAVSTVENRSYLQDRSQGAFILRQLREVVLAIILYCLHLCTSTSCKDAGKQEEQSPQGEQVREPWVS
jgi:hypothetical protein